MSGKKGMKHYLVETKLAAVRLHLEEGKTYAEVARLLAVTDPQRIEVWVRQYRREGTAGLNKPKGRLRKRTESADEELKRLRMENDLLKNSKPNCEKTCSRSAISGHLPPSNRVRRESPVPVLWNFASRLLCLGGEDGSLRPRCRALGVGSGSLPKVASHLRVPQNYLVDRQAQGPNDQSQGSFAVNEQTPHSFHRPQTQTLQKNDRLGNLPSL